MRKFILHTLLYLLPVILLVGSAEITLRTIPNNYRQKYQWMSSHSGDLEVLMLGNSHGLFGLRPDQFTQPTYNLCNVSQIFEYDEYLLNRFLPQCSHLHTVILVCDHSNLFDPPLEESEAYRCTYYRLYMDYPKHSLLSNYGFEVSHIKASGEKLTQWIQGRNESCDSLGFLPQEGLQRFPEEDADWGTVSARQHCEQDTLYAYANREKLFQIAAHLQQEGIRLILVQTPVTEAYTRAIQANWSWNDRFLRQTLETCHNRYGAIIEDFSTAPRFQAQDFSDADHLSAQGAQKFSHYLSHALQ